MLKLKLHGFFWELRYYTCLIIMGPEIICLSHFGFWRNFPAEGGFQSRLRCWGWSKEDSFLLVPEKDLNSYWIPNVVVCLNFNLGNRFWSINFSAFEYLNEFYILHFQCTELRNYKSWYSVSIHIKIECVIVWTYVLFYSNYVIYREGATGEIGASPKFRPWNHFNQQKI